MQVHFIAGFPRCGSSMLSSILRQNPRFHTDIQTPMGQVIVKTQDQMSHNVNEAASQFSDEDRLRILRGIFTAFFEDRAQGRPVAFDCNRRWCANMALVNALFPGSKVIALVRDPAAVLDSFERLFAAHPAEVNRIIASPNTNVYDRVEQLLAKEAICGFSFNSFRGAYFGAHKKNLLVIEYDDLATRTKLVLEQLHVALGEEPFEYDLENLEQLPSWADFDREIGSPGLHRVKSKVVYEQRVSILPPDIIERLPKPFWRLPAPINEPITPAV